MTEQTGKNIIKVKCHQCIIHQTKSHCAELINSILMITLILAFLNLCNSAPGFNAVDENHSRGNNPAVPWWWARNNNTDLLDQASLENTKSLFCTWSLRSINGQFLKLSECHHKSHCISFLHSITINARWFHVTYDSIQNIVHIHSCRSASTTPLSHREYWLPANPTMLRPHAASPPTPCLRTDRDCLWPRLRWDCPMDARRCTESF